MIKEMLDKEELAAVKGGQDPIPLTPKIGDADDYGNG